jgi:hypothetical protein
MAPIKQVQFTKRPLQRKVEINCEPLTREQIKSICQTIDSAGSSSAVGKYYIDQPVIACDLQELKKP